jgi:hypothetical protein
MFRYPGHHHGPFEATYRAFPLAFIDKQSADYGDKVILPPSALHRLGEQQPAAAGASCWQHSSVIQLQTVFGWLVGSRACHQGSRWQSVATAWTQANSWACFFCSVRGRHMVHSTAGILDLGGGSATENAVQRGTDSHRQSHSRVNARPGFTAGPALYCQCSRLRVSCSKPTLACSCQHSSCVLIPAVPFCCCYCCWLLLPAQRLLRLSTRCCSRWSTGPLAGPPTAACWSLWHRRDMCTCLAG